MVQGDCGIQGEAMTQTRSPVSAPIEPSRDVALALSQLHHAWPRLGLFSRAEANDHGLTDEMLRVLVRAGVLIRPIRGWYHIADPEFDIRALHRRAAMAQVLRHERRAVASHHSALTEHGLPTLGADLATVHLTYRRAASYRSGRRLMVHRADASTDANELASDATAVGVPFAVVQAGLVNGALATLVAGDAALGKGLTTMSEIVRAAQAYRHHRGIASVRAVAAQLNGLAESPAESLARCVVNHLGYSVTAQRWITVEGRDYRVDLAIEGTPLVIEVDGMSKYADHPMEAIRSEKDRHARLERGNWIVLRLTWREIITPDGRLRFANVQALIEAKLRHHAA